jgi:ribosomal protein S18 acetylase RimI-like enzyme
MALDYALRPASKDETEALYTIHRAAMENYVSQTWGSWDDAWQRDHFANHWPDVRLAIESSGQLAGFLDLDEQGESIHVGNIELRPESQGKGIGSAILKAVQQRAELKRVPVTLQVLKVNPARALYERLGFQHTGETETHHLMAWEAPQ